MKPESLAQKIRLSSEHPLDFTLQYPPRREYFQDHFRGSPDLNQLRGLREVLLYVHVPFCQAKCYFCNFAVDIRNAPEIHDSYVDALCAQLDRLQHLMPSDTGIPGIDIGGGTPTLLNATLLEKILIALAPFKVRATTQTPLSIETTPRIASEHPERLSVLAAGGVTRISMGVQSTNATALAAVNRSAQINQTESAVNNIRAAGFKRVNADIIFGMPHQTIPDWQNSLRHVIELGFDSITTYDCLYRGKGRAMTKRTKDKPTPEIYGTMYDLAYDMLSDSGYHAAYGSVNFSKIPGETGTSPYFEGRLLHHLPYLGAGNYASSMLGNNWWFAPYGVNEFVKRTNAGEALPVGDGYDLPSHETIAKQTLLSFNFGYIDTESFRKRFGVQIEDIYADAIYFGLEKGWLKKTQKGYGVHKGKFQYMPQIRALFYTDKAINWLQSFKDQHHEKNELSLHG
jgi:oxygen-independent coproporphyrinogen-3 oxidase